jgi:hypothetical protein
VKHHGDTAFVGGLDDLGVADGSAGVDGSGGAGFGGGDEAIGKGKNASLQTTLPARESPASPAFQTAMRLASTRLIWPAPMPRVRPWPGRRR